MKQSLMVVLEGPECTGKSTQAQILAERYSCSISKRVRTGGRFQMLSAVFSDISQQVLRTSGVYGGETLVLFDRWQLVSDIVYEKHCYNRKSILEPLMSILANACKDANICIVYMAISEEEMLRRFRLRGDKLRTLEEAVIVRQAYEDFFEFCLLPYIRIDVDSMTVDEVTKEITIQSGINNLIF